MTAGAALLDSSFNFGIDVDPDAIVQSTENFCELDLYVDLIQTDVEKLLEKPSIVQRWKADTVIMNPPFGTKNKGVDMSFLQLATMVFFIFTYNLKISENAIYSLHKTSTRDVFIL